MNLIKQKFAAILISFFIVNTALAMDCYDTCYRPCEVYLASPCYTFEAIFRPLYLQPHSNNLSYAIEAVQLPASSPNWIAFDIQPCYNFGFDVGLSVIDHERNVKTSLNWEHFQSRSSASKHVPSTNMIGPFFEIGPDASIFKRAHGRVKFLYDSVDFDLGILVSFGDCLQTNFFAGAGAVGIKQSLFSRFSSEDKATVRTIKVPSKFSGVGPEIGLDFSYCVAEGFCLMGNAMAAIYVGRLKNHTFYESLSPSLAALGLTSPNKQSIDVQKRTQIVPALKGRLGLAYSLVFCNGSRFNVEAGYEASVYINAIQSIDMASEVVSPPVTPDTVGVFGRTFHRSLSNFALAGPYLSVSLGF